MALWATLIVAVALLLGPGPKYEEVFGCIAWTFALGVLCLGCSAIRPRPVEYAVVSFVATACVWLGTSIQVAYRFGYPMWPPPGLLTGLYVAAIGAMATLAVNLAIVYARSWARGFDN